MATPYTKEAKPLTPYIKESATDFLLKEDAFYLLLENGGKIIIKQDFVTTVYTKEAKP